MKTALFRKQMKLQFCHFYFFPQSKTVTSITCHYNSNANFQLGPVWVKCGSSGGRPEAAAAAARKRARGGGAHSCHPALTWRHTGRAEVLWPDMILQRPWPLSAVWRPANEETHSNMNHNENRRDELIYLIWQVRQCAIILTIVIGPILTVQVVIVQHTNCTLWCCFWPLAV